MNVLVDTRAQRAERRRAHEDANLFGRIQAAAMASRVQGKKFLDAAGGLSIPEWRILWDLHEAGPLSMQDMATIQRADHSLISRAMTGMRQKGYVTVQRDDDDKRQTLVHLTEDGLRAYLRAAPVMKRRRALLANGFTESEMAQFLDLIDRFEQHLAQSHPPQSGEDQ